MSKLEYTRARREGADKELFVPAGAIDDHLGAGATEGAPHVGVLQLHRHPSWAQQLVLATVGRIRWWTQQTQM